jgi:hypothetical protein
MGFNLRFIVDADFFSLIEGFPQKDGKPQRFYGMNGKNCRISFPELQCIG